MKKRSYSLTPAKSYCGWLALEAVAFQFLFSASNANHDHVLGVSVLRGTTEVRSTSHANRIASQQIDKHGLIVSVAVPLKPVMYYALLNFNMSTTMLSGLVALPRG